MARSTRKAILLDDVEHLGDRGEVVAVSRGYLRNYLVPRKLAEEATPARIAEVERLAATRAAQEARTLEQANEIATLLTKTVLTIPARSGPDGRLYGSVTAADLADEIWRARKVRVDRRKIRLEEPIKAIGSYLVEIDVFPEVRAAVKTQVVQVEGFEFDDSAAVEAEVEAEVVADEAVAEEIVDEVVDELAGEAAEQAD